MAWSLTVAAIIERDGRYLVVEERDKNSERTVINQPAGHVEDGESALDAVIRETWEEAGAHFIPERIIGFYPLMAKNGKDYFRVCYAGTIREDSILQPQDSDILRCHWMTVDEIRAFGPRSSLVLECISDYVNGHNAPLSAIKAIQKDRPSVLLK